VNFYIGHIFMAQQLGNGGDKIGAAIARAVTKGFALRGHQKHREHDIVVRHQYIIVAGVVVGIAAGHLYTFG
jgi:hypothetical protein